MTAPNSRAGPPDLAASGRHLGHFQGRIDFILHPGQLPGVAQLLQKVDQAAVWHGGIVREEGEKGEGGERYSGQALRLSADV